MDCYEGPYTLLIIALNGGLYLVIIMDRHEVTDSELTIGLDGVL
jgi:hypothetical protein